MAGTKLVRVLANAQDLIRVLAEEGPLTPAEISEALTIPRATVYRLAEGLAAIGLARFTADGRVELTERWLHLGEVATAAMPEWKNATAVLSELRDRTEQTVYLSVLRGSRAVCIDWLPGSGLGVLLWKPGRSLPMHAGAAGRVMLAFGQIDVAEYAAGRLTTYTDRTLTGPADLAADVATTRARGYATSDEDVTTGIGALGAPVFDQGDRLAAAVSIGGLAAELRVRHDEFAGEVRAAAERLRPV